jgi:hypothetical protein
VTQTPSAFLVFVDESGDHGLQSIDAAYPVFVLVFCIVNKSDYAKTWLPAVTEFKFRHFGHDQIILHERDIRKDVGSFVFLRDRARKHAFLTELTDLVSRLDMTVVASVIRKDWLAGQYAYPSNPYEIALAFGLERVHMWLNRSGGSGGTSVMIECRGRREDEQLELEFRRICAGGNFRRATLNFTPVFVPKSANVPGLQIADLIARPIGRHVLDPAQPNRAFEVIESKLDRSPRNEVDGWGLKVFP